MSKKPNPRNLAFGLEIPQEVKECLKELSIATASREEDYLILARKLSLNADISRNQVVNLLENNALECLREDQSDFASLAIILLLDCASYYECLGNSRKGVDLSEKALTFAQNLRLLALQRRAHNALSVFLLKQRDFNRSCVHVEKAFKLSLLINDPLYTIAIQCNIVALLASIGLTRSAVDFALKVSRTIIDNDCQHHLLRLQNANNGLRYSLALGDLESADIFYEISCESMSLASNAASEISLTYFESNRAIYLVAKGELNRAFEYINLAIASLSKGTNIRVEALLRCAQAEVHLALCESSGIQKSRKWLDELLTHLAELPENREDVLRVLVKLCAASPILRDRKSALKYIATLREHLVAVKHRCFFVDLSGALGNSSNQSDGLSNPSYSIPAWMSDVDGSSWPSAAVAEQGPVNVRQADDFSISPIELSRNKLEARFRSPHYQIAENWAVAVEFAAEGSGYHCFRVGSLAHAIGAELGLTSSECMRLELACRLHDIGKVVSAFSERERRSLRSVGQYSVICEHTLAGERILSVAADVTLQLAAKIAKGHHEWWNGCGYPCGAKGESIPLEARICSIADMFVALVTPSAGDVARWTVSAALRQVTCMAGVQIDPQLIRPLSNALKSKKVQRALGLAQSTERYQGSGLTAAKEQLFETIELIG